MIGVFSDKKDADFVIDHLKDLGYNASEISVVLKNNIHIHEDVASKGGMAAEGAISGAATGGVIGGVAGLLIGLGAITIPGFGAILIGGPLASALGLTGAAAIAVSGATTGVVAGGILGAFATLGIPQSIAKVYAKRVSQGAVLLAVPIDQRLDEEQVKKIFDSHHAEDVRTIDTRTSG